MFFYIDAVYSYITAITKKNLVDVPSLIKGVDVTHSSPTDSHSLSIAAIVMNTDLSPMRLLQKFCEKDASHAVLCNIYICHKHSNSFFSYQLFSELHLWYCQTAHFTLTTLSHYLNFPNLNYFIYYNILFKCKSIVLCALLDADMEPIISILNY